MLISDKYEAESKEMLPTLRHAQHGNCLYKALKYYSCH